MKKLFHILKVVYLSNFEIRNSPMNILIKKIIFNKKICVMFHKENRTTYMIDHDRHTGAALSQFYGR